MLRPLWNTSIALLLVVITSVSWAQTGSKPALYQVQKGSLKLFVVGSIHAGKDNFYPLAPEIEQAFEQSDTLYLEITPEQMSPSKVGRAMREYALLSTPLPLKMRMSDKLYQQLLVTIEKYQLPAHQLMFMKDWSIIIQLTVAAIQEMGLNKDHGVDHYFARKARKSNKPVRGLESIDEQFKAIALMEELGSEALYQNFFDEMKLAAQWLTLVEQAWRRGDSQALSQLYHDYDVRQQQAELMQALLDNRNAQWHQKLIELPANQTYMLVVGDMHIHGSNNILQLLKESGFTVTRLNPIS